MDATEKLVKQHLSSRGFNDVVYEPDGNIPPDFLINGNIAVEVRRLNQNHFDGTTTKGLEETSIPLWKKIQKLIASFGPPTSDESWFVFFRFGRPVEEWRTLEAKIRSALETFDKNPVRTSGPVLTASGFELDVTRASKVHATKFLMAGCSDAESGGVILAEMQANITYCASEKSHKIAAVRSKYGQWWLALVDHIGFGMSDFDRELFRDQVSVTHNWDKILIIDPLDVTRYLEL